MEVTITGRQFRTGTLDAFKQFHIIKRLAPFTVALVEAAKQLRKSIPEATTKETFGELMERIDVVKVAGGPLAEVIAKIPDADTDFIFNTCLAVTQINQDGVWVDVVSKLNGTLMFHNLTMAELIGISFAVIRENMGGFFLIGQQA